MTEANTQNNHIPSIILTEHPQFMKKKMAQYRHSMGQLFELRKKSNLKTQIIEKGNPLLDGNIECSLVRKRGLSQNLKGFLNGFSRVNSPKVAYQASNTEIYIKKEVKKTDRLIEELLNQEHIPQGLISKKNRFNPQMDTQGNLSYQPMKVKVSYFIDQSQLDRPAFDLYKHANQRNFNQREASRLAPAVFDPATNKPPAGHSTKIKPRNGKPEYRFTDCGSGMLSAKPHSHLVAGSRSPAGHSRHESSGAIDYRCAEIVDRHKSFDGESVRYELPQLRYRSRKLSDAKESSETQAADIVKVRMDRFYKVRDSMLCRKQIKASVSVSKNDENNKITREKSQKLIKKLHEHSKQKKLPNETLAWKRNKNSSKNSRFINTQLSPNQIKTHDAHAKSQVILVKDEYLNEIGKCELKAWGKNLNDTIRSELEFSCD